MKKIFILLFVFLFLIKIFPKEVSILLLKEKKQINLGSKYYKVNNKKVLINSISLYNGKLYLNDEKIDRNNIFIKPLNNDYVQIQGRMYRGYLRIYTDYFYINIINRVNVEQYLKGVLPKEINYKWPMDAIKAQAIAARTFVYKKIEKNGDKIFQLDSSYYSQVYGGKDRETNRTNKAVEETENIVITYRNNLIYAFYHSSSGGITANSNEVWNSNNSLEYLSSRKDPFSINAPNSNWEYFISRDKFKKIFNIKKLKRVKLYYTKSKRVKYFKIIGKYKTKKITGNNFRIKIGPKKIKSTLFKVDYSGSMLKFWGKGWGHGVGMSQWGAYYMAKKGYSYKDIIKFYYKDIKLAKVDI